MRCLKCKKEMVVKNRDISHDTYNQEKKYERIVYWCKHDDIWISLETPQKTEQRRQYSGNDINKISKTDNNLISKKSIEVLHHFQCAFCKKWWTIGDAPKRKNTAYCPWCGKENKYNKQHK